MPILRPLLHQLPAFHEAGIIGAESPGLDGPGHLFDHDHILGRFEVALLDHLIHQLVGEGVYGPADEPTHGTGGRLEEGRVPSILDLLLDFQELGPGLGHGSPHLVEDVLVVDDARDTRIAVLRGTDKEELAIGSDVLIEDQAVGEVIEPGVVVAIGVGLLEIFGQIVDDIRIPVVITREVDHHHVSQGIGGHVSLDPIELIGNSGTADELVLQVNFGVKIVPLLQDLVIGIGTVVGVGVDLAPDSYGELPLELLHRCRFRWGRCRYRGGSQGLCGNYSRLRGLCATCQNYQDQQTD